MTTNPHYFIAIPLQAPLKEYLSYWQDRLKTHLAYKQWPHYEDLHITLKFLGAVDDSKIQQLRRKLKIIEHTQTFSIEVGGLGTFGNPEKPRVLWAGVDKTALLTSLQQKVEDLASNLGFSKETRVYRPHITLAKKWAGGSSTIFLEDMKKQFSHVQTMAVEEVVLYQIHPRRSVKYEVVANFRLCKKRKKTYS
ncbi:RNA 2',3'-cyclic phosphodiesterase [Virgibacillus sp. NKC19-3]|uniref:RNA 2',3'-cyclic phosphodiesterase n=1 Tax=Virgibacillus saliphilus TaxID=2831674 RepID=UPI001C9A6641|nr:RNA 2',3'-cyclic phosphodiesterase [Virgibacillus sp. NKC19-3]MBY7143912.1 RNA 2',3'-cyclic phosphodiesterase [Virgibacillus sp. NKC19-3]